MTLLTRQASTTLSAFNYKKNRKINGDNQNIQFKDLNQYSLTVYTVCDIILICFAKNKENPTH